MAFVSPLPIASRSTPTPTSAVGHSSFPCSPLIPTLRRNASSIRAPTKTTDTPQALVMSAVDVKTHEVFMPALSSTMTEGKIVQWLKQPGDPVSSGDPIMVVESDKADMDVESFEDGFLAAIFVEEGESCPVGEAVGVLVKSKDDIDRVQQAAQSTPSATSSEPVAAAAPAASSPTATAPAAPAAPAPPAPTAQPKFKEVFMPALSSTMTEGKVVQWLKAEGDTVESGEIVMVVESDKADMDVESFDSGVIAHISVNEGESIAVGEAVALIAKTQDEVAAIKAWALSNANGAPAEAVEAAPAPAGDPVADPTASATPAAPAPTAPAAAQIVNSGRIVASPLAKAVAKKENVDLRYVAGTGPNGRIVEADVLKAKDGGSSPTAVAPPVPQSTSGKVVATPDAKKVAKKEKIDLATVTGTGNFGRITADDVLKAAGKVPSPPAAVPAPAKEEKIPVAAKSVEKATAKPVEAPSGAVSMNAMQKAVVQNMNASLAVPVFRITYKIKTKALDELYAKVKPKGVTMSALLAKAVAISLIKHPIMNAAYAENTIVYRENINVAMAVAMPDGGLITPTLKNADSTDLYSLSRTWKDLVKRAADKKLSPDEYNSGTFFISNLGMFGVEQFDAILPPGAPGILAIGASKPVVGLQSNGLVGVEKEMSVTLTADHRHIYGADGAKFLKDLTDLIEGDVMELLM